MIVDVVVPVHGNWELTEQCLDSLPHEAPIGRIIVVDDASPDDTAEQLVRRHDVETVTLERNGGFAVACNAGAARSRADAVLFLNNDTIVPPGAIARMAATLEADPTIGAVAPLLLFGDGTIQSAGIAFIEPTHATSLYAHLDETTPQATRPRDDLLLNGAVLLVRRDLFVAIGGFHEAYLNGAEDMDLSLLIWNRGFRCRYEPAARVIHLEGASRGKRPEDHGNHALLGRRWNGIIDTFPQLRWPDPPVLAIAWNARDGLDRLVRDRLLRMLKQFGGARRGLVRNALERTAMRVLAHFDGRAFLEIGYGTGRGDVRIVAPRDAKDLQSVEPCAAARYWVPAPATRDALVARGIPAERVSTFFLGADVAPHPLRTSLEDAVILVASRERAQALEATRVTHALAGVSTRVVTYEQAAEADVAAVRQAGLVVALDEDPWQLFASEALAGGAVLVVPSQAPIARASLPQSTVVIAEGAGALADAVADVRSRFATYAPRGARAAREISRRYPQVYAGRRLRELARTAAHDVPEADIVAVTPSLAAKLREAPTPQPSR